MKQIKLGIIDDESLILNLLEDFFNGQDDIDVLVTSTSGSALLNELEQSNTIPDVFLVDFKMNDLTGTELTEALKLKYPDVRVILISSYYKKSLIGYMLRNNIDAFLPKGIEPNELARIIRIVDRRGHFFTNEQIEVMRTQISNKVPAPKFDDEILSAREKEILIAICEQLTSKETAEKLFITTRTVEGHRNSLLQKTGAKNSAGLVIYAIKNNLYDPNDLIM
ncbi:response regulator transcription factor [bacterium]|jgi:DNA-binding NarL/FixJ family response regulator|nr:response regulator transcription factor [bacterium]